MLIPAPPTGVFVSFQDEWQRGLKALTVDTVNKLKNALLELENETQNDYKVINMDQWTSFLRFCCQVSRFFSFTTYFTLHFCLFLLFRLLYNHFCIYFGR
ncbi:hypothetical protein HYC85_003500 [Camellia sinensis]|uniref:Uncharacterized protein n=1 Tax=Camellia sinensis TaxID=4442 RepID=A0A7J7HUV1_CAMSI|nr:hypothetical protein HYC85_003500 [Camellia sinensis]